MERRSGFLYFAWPVASIAVLFAFPLSFWYVPAWGASFPASRSNSPWPSLPLTPVLQQPPLRQPHSPFTLFLSKILERGKDSRPSLLLPDSLRLHPLSSSSTPNEAPAVFLPSGCSRRWVTSTSTSSSLKEGAKSSERSKRSASGGWSGSGEACDYF